MIRPFLGLRDPLFALSLLAIDPHLKGVLIGGPSGTGKSALARAARVLWPEGTPFVEVPLHCTLERLVGGRALFGGGQRASISPPNKGLLARAHGGVLFVDDIHLLPLPLLAVLVQTLSSGEVCLEREGLSCRYPSRFVLVATFNPQEAPLPELLLHSVAFTVQTHTLRDLETRMYLAGQQGQGLIIPADIVQSVQEARRILPQVNLVEKHLRELCAVATRMGVEGNRCEFFAVRCARANAALHRRVPVTRGDVDLAIRLVYLPRVGESVLPGGESGDQPAEGHQPPQRKASNEQPRPDQPAEAHWENPNSRDGNRSAGGGEADGQRSAARARQLFRDLPLAGGQVEIPELPEPGRPAMGSPVQGGRRGGLLNFRGGRYIRAVPGSPARGRVDVLATLKAAALDHAIRSRQAAQGWRVQPHHVHIKQFERKSGWLFLFVVDASGSMVLNHLDAARQAALQLLQQAYIHRDRVALLTFQGEGAKLVLPPGGGISRARRALQVMRTGGRTPLSDALSKCMTLAVRARQRWQVAGTVLVLFTDGRANQPLQPVKGRDARKEAAWREVQQLALHLRSHLDAAVVFDVRVLHIPGGPAEQLARWLGATYLHFSQTGRKTLAAQVAGLVRPGPPGR
ncbi:MAG: VWA domain-containing protein [Calditrichaeota bacterium]|nr:MAG: VWA domain-containing protein [Calditrichota bacterium]